MFSVIKVCKKQVAFTKSTYTPENRKRWLIPPDIYCTNTFIKDDILFVNEQVKHYKTGDKTKLLIYVESQFIQVFSNDVDLNPNEDEFKLFSTGNTWINYDLLSFLRLDNGLLDLSTKFSCYSSNLGFPKRINHKIGLLNPLEQVLYMVNGQSDFTLSGRKQRTFNEFFYTSNFLGLAKSIRYSDLDTLNKFEKQAISKSKSVDERVLFR